MGQEGKTLCMDSPPPQQESGEGGPFLGRGPQPSLRALPPGPERLRPGTQDILLADTGLRPEVPAPVKATGEKVTRPGVQHPEATKSLPHTLSLQGPRAISLRARVAPRPSWADQVLALRKGSWSRRGWAAMAPCSVGAVTRSGAPLAALREAGKPRGSSRRCLKAVAVLLSMVSIISRSVDL